MMGYLQPGLGSLGHSLGPVQQAGGHRTSPPGLSHDPDR